MVSCESWWMGRSLGWMTLGRDGIYAWDPAPLLAAKMSAERLEVHMEDTPPAQAVREALGGGDLSDEEAERLVQATDNDALIRAYLDILDRRAGIGWTTSGHTAVDVNLYAFGPGSTLFSGAMTNDAVGRAVFAALGL